MVRADSMAVHHGVGCGTASCWATYLIHASCPPTLLAHAPPLPLARLHMRWPTWPVPVPVLANAGAAVAPPSERRRARSARKGEEEGTPAGRMLPARHPRTVLRSTWTPGGQNKAGFGRAPACKGCAELPLRYPVARLSEAMLRNTSPSSTQELRSTFFYPNMDSILMHLVDHEHTTGRPACRATLLLQHLCFARESVQSVLPLHKFFVSSCGHAHASDAAPSAGCARGVRASRNRHRTIRVTGAV